MVSLTRATVDQQNSKSHSGATRSPSKTPEWPLEHLPARNMSRPGTPCVYEDDRKTSSSVQQSVHRLYIIPGRHTPLTPPLLYDPYCTIRLKVVRSRNSELNIKDRIKMEAVSGVLVRRRRRRDEQTLMSCIKKHKTSNQEALEHKNKA